MLTKCHKRSGRLPRRPSTLKSEQCGKGTAVNNYVPSQINAIRSSCQRLTICHHWLAGASHEASGNHLSLLYIFQRSTAKSVVASVRVLQMSRIGILATHSDPSPLQGSHASVSWNESLSGCAWLLRTWFSKCKPKWLKSRHRGSAYKMFSRKGDLPPYVFIATTLKEIKQVETTHGSANDIMLLHFNKYSFLPSSHLLNRQLAKHVWQITLKVDKLELLRVWPCERWVTFFGQAEIVLQSGLRVWRCRCLLALQ